MTYTKRNLSLVIAIGAIMAFIPLASNPNAFAETSETTAVIVGSCGYNVPVSAAFATITPGTTTTLAVTFADWTVVADKNGSSRILIEAEDWDGLGDRAEGTITITTIAEDQVVVVNTVTYTAKDAPGAAPEFQSTTGATTAQVAESLAAAIRTDPLIRSSSANTNVVTVQAETRGNGLSLAQNDYILTSTGTSVALLPADGSLGGGGGNVAQHLPAENTRYDITTDNTAPSTTYSTMSAFKTEALADVTPLEIIGGTDVTNPLKVSLAIDVTTALTNLPYEGQITQGITVTITCNGT